MPIRTHITIDDAELATTYAYDLDPTRLPDEYALHVFIARVEPSELRRLFPSPPRYAIEGISVLNVLGHPHPRDVDLEEEVVPLSIEPESAELVVLGTEPCLLICEAFDHTDEVAMARQRPGDKKFLASLPADLKTLGEDLLAAIRSKYSGELLLNEKARRYVESPDQWFTVKPQHRTKTKTFAITVRARPTFFLEMEDDEFTVAMCSDGKSVEVDSRDPIEINPLELKPDGGSSSRFVLSRREQIATAMRILQWASKNRKLPHR